MKTRQTLLFIITIAGIFSMCEKEDAIPELIAKTGPDTTASIGDTVWLDASASTGTYYEIKWTFHNQPGNDQIADDTTNHAYFIPTINGAYQAKLTISKGSIFHSDYQNIAVSGAVLLDSEITEFTRLKKIALDKQADYRVSGKLNVTAQLIVEIGVIIEFDTEGYMEISNGGKIYAENASFIASDSTWRGINILSKGNSFTNCLIENAGNRSFTDDPEEKAAVILGQNSTMAFSGNTVKYSGGYGIVVTPQAAFYFDSENQVYAFRNNRFIANAGGPMVIPANVLSDLSGQYFEEETEGTYIQIYGSSYPATNENNAWISGQGIPYLVTGLIEFNKTLTIGSGVRMYFESDAGMVVNGMMTVSGTSENPVSIDGVSGNPGSWKGIYVHGGQTDINYMNLLNAGSETLPGTDKKASLTVEQLLSMKNSEISGSGGIGLYMPGTAHIQYTENFVSNTLQNNAAAAIQIRMDDVTKVVNDNTINSPASIPSIMVHMGVDDPLGTWKNLDGDYDYKVLESLTIKATKELLIEAGTTIKMPASSILTVNGGLTAKGSAGNEISIKGTSSTQGHWDGIILNGSQTVSLDHVLVSDGGGGFEDKGNLILHTGAADVSVTNSTFNNSKGYAVLVKLGASGFEINDPASKNTMEGNLGGYHDENL